MKKKLIILVGGLLLLVTSPAFSDPRDSNDVPINPDQTLGSEDDGPEPPPSVPINKCLPALLVVGLSIGYFKLVKK
jgi:hypothetical protein